MYSIKKLIYLGEVPIERYPLVCPPSIGYDRNATFMSKNEFQRLAAITKPICPEPDPQKERLERLRGQSQLLQMGWPDNKKDVVKRLAEKFLTNTNLDKDLKEIEVRQKIADCKPKKRQGFAKSLTGNNNFFMNLTHTIPKTGFKVGQ